MHSLWPIVALTVAVSPALISVKGSPIVGVSRAGDVHFPMSKGTYWVYRGRVQGHDTRLNCDSAPLVSEDVTWRMEVIDAIDRGHFSAAVIAGHVVDLRDAEIANGRVNARREESLLIRREGEKYYLLQDKAMQMAMARMKDPADSLEGLLNDRTGPALDLPLKPGKVFGDPEQMAMQEREIESGQTQYIGWLYVVDKAS